ncbi:MAG TPA: glycoside hydrolase family 2 TIM barrel-domain containing protein [Solirubrobacteraceae bacterium]|nr:glycoside hydrolase family 2 TIM barrel-domain containing protein [Solirubrobacteraceae bacterium]
MAPHSPPASRRRRLLQAELVIFMLCFAAAIVKTLVQGLEYAPGPSYLITTKGPVRRTPPQPIDLSKGWQYLPDPHNVGLADNWAHGGATTFPWTPVTIPNTFNPTISAAEDLGSVGWYRIAFRGPPAASERGWEVSFEEARKVTDVWLNGRYLGQNDDAYVPFTFAASSLHPGAVNHLIVRVDNRLLPGHIPEDWWNYGGIVRPVSLEPVGRIQLSNLGVMPQLACGYSCGHLLVVGTLTNHSPSTLSPGVAVKVTSPAGRVTTTVTGEGAIAPGDRRQIRFQVPVHGPLQLWGPGHPYLYRVSVATTAQDRVEQVNRMQIGMRSVQVTHGVLYLNGHRLWLHGASIVDDTPGHGAALTNADIDTTVSELKTLGANITRAHYVLSNAMLDKLDQAGILVWNQPPVYHYDPVLATAAGRAGALRMLEDTIIAARSHPSVVIDSIGNELTPTPSTTPGTLTYLRQAIPLVHRLDPTAPVALDIYCYPGYARQPIYAKLNILGINDYFGWYPGQPGHSTASFADFTPYLTLQHQRYPGQALVVSEFGAEALYDGLPQVKGTYQFQTDYVRSTIDALDALPFMSGSIYWTLREFAVRPGWKGGLAPPLVAAPTGLTHKALISYGGMAKPAFAVTQHLFADPPAFAR